MCKQLAQDCTRQHGGFDLDLRHVDRKSFSRNTVWTGLDIIRSPLNLSRVEVMRMEVMQMEVMLVEKPTYCTVRCFVVDGSWKDTTGHVHSLLLPQWLATSHCRPFVTAISMDWRTGEMVSKYITRFHQHDWIWLRYWVSRCVSNY